MSEIRNFEINKRAEAYAKFGSWCRDHQISPWHAAECIDLCIQADRPLNYHRSRELRDQVIARLSRAGACEIEFRGGWPEFTSAIGERTTLPFRRFI